MRLPYPLNSGLKHFDTQAKQGTVGFECVDTRNQFSSLVYQSYPSLPFQDAKAADEDRTTFIQHMGITAFGRAMSALDAEIGFLYVFFINKTYKKDPLIWILTRRDGTFLDGDCIRHSKKMAQFFSTMRLLFTTPQSAHEQLARTALFPSMDAIAP
jgi:hypothetical protein